jgi:hypothetical protein
MFGGSIAPRNVGILPQPYTISQLRRPRFESSPLRKPRICHQADSHSAGQDFPRIFGTRSFITVFTGVLRWGAVSPSPNLEAGRPLLVGCPRLISQYIRSYPPYLSDYIHVPFPSCMYLTLKMKAARPSETLVTYHITTRRHIPEEVTAHLFVVTFDCYERKKEKIINKER